MGDADKTWGTKMVSVRFHKMEGIGQCGGAAVVRHHKFSRRFQTKGDAMIRFPVCHLLQGNLQSAPAARRSQIEMVFIITRQRARALVCPISFTSIPVGTCLIKNARKYVTYRFDWDMGLAVKRVEILRTVVAFPNQRKFQRAQIMGLYRPTGYVD